MPLINNRPPVVSGPIIVTMFEDSVVASRSPTLNSFDPDLIDLVRATGIPDALPKAFSFDLQFHQFHQFHQFVIDSFDPSFQSLAQGQVIQITPHCLARIIPDDQIIASLEMISEQFVLGVGHEADQHGHER
jgi:hypothetical protein